MFALVQLLTAVPGLFAYQDGTDAATGSAWQVLIVYAVVIGSLFYFLMVRPQRNRLRRHQDLVSALSTGDLVTTIGGIYGTIEHMDEESVILQVEGGGRLRVARRALAGKVEG